LPTKAGHSKTTLAAIFGSLGGAVLIGAIAALFTSKKKIKNNKEDNKTNN